MCSISPEAAQVCRNYSHIRGPGSAADYGNVNYEIISFGYESKGSGFDRHLNKQLSDWGNTTHSYIADGSLYK